MAIVEALKKFGVSLLGENYTPTEAKTDSQIAETIEGISKAIDDAGGIGGGSGGGSGIEIKMKVDVSSGSPSIDPLPPGLSVSDFSDVIVKSYAIIEGIEYPVGIATPIYVSQSLSGPYIQITMIGPGSEGFGPEVLQYDPATGEITILGDDHGDA